MTVADTFFKQFEILADAPNAVPKLRELILQLAVRGKLVSQDPNDEPASILLKHIESEKEQLLKEGKIKASKSISAITKEESLFKIPIKWKWVKLECLISLLGDGIHGTPTYSETGDYYFINGNNLQDGEIIIKSTTKTVAFEEYCKYKKSLSPSTVFVSINGTLGNVAFYNNQNIILGKSVCYFNLLNGINKYYLKLIIESRYFLDYAHASATGSTIKNVSLRTMRDFPVPLPPLNEQKRIVEKVDKLMEWCDRLEKQQQQRRETCINLNRVALTQLTTAKTTDEFSDRWQKVHDNFDLLYSLPENVSQLRQTILQLAVMGKLVKQDPNDEPASILLEKIKIEKLKLIANKKADKEINTSLEENKLGLTIPSCWQWIQLGEIIISIRYGTSKHCSYESQGHPVLRIPNLVNGKIDIEDLKYTNLTDKECKDLELKESDILIIRSNGSTSLVGRSAIVDSSINGYAYAGYLVRLRFLLDFIFPNYIHLALSTPFVREQIELPIRTTSGVKNINSTEIANLTFPIPPLNEQKRIVAKVEEMMRLCDGLEAKLKDAETNRQKLLESGIRQVLSQI